MSYCKTPYIFFLTFIFMSNTHSFSQANMDIKLSLIYENSSVYYEVINNTTKKIKFNIYNINNINPLKLEVYDGTGQRISLGCGEAMLNYNYIASHKSNYRIICPKDTLLVKFDPQLCYRGVVNNFILNIPDGEYKAVLKYNLLMKDGVKYPENALIGEFKSDTLYFVK